MPWYKQWFGSVFYDTLYKHRDEKEALSFIKKVFDVLHPPSGSEILDLACGNGRHTLALSAFGKVTGADISPGQIAKARKRNIPSASFLVHDMRQTVKPDFFDFVFNIFSSFGYFEKESEDLKVLQSVCENLKPNGIFVHDFLNASYVLKRLKETDLVNEGELTFKIKRRTENKKIVKEIRVYKRGIQEGVFFENVTAYRSEELIKLHKQAGLTPLKVYGNYNLSDFDEDHSPRVIIFSKKEVRHV